MIKKNIVVSTMLFVGLALSVSAQTTTAPKLRADIKEVRQDTRINIEALRKAEQERINAIRASSTEARKASSTEENARRVNMARKEVAMILLRLNAAVGRIQGLSERVTSRLDKFASQGGDVTLSRKDITDAKARLDEARVKITAIKTAADTIFTNPVPKGTKIMKDLEALVKDAAKTVQDAQRLVAKSISDIKPGLYKVRPATGAATTTRD